MQLMMKAMVQQSRAQDKLWKETGIEEDQVLYSIEQLELEKDSEFQQMLQENIRKTMEKAQHAQGGMLGGGGGGMGAGGMMF